MDDQQQAFTVDAAAAGSGFTRTVISSMGFLLALFFGLSPLVILVALMSGANALPLIGKYILFGAWTQSWLPMAYVVNFFVLHTWSDAMRQLLDGVTGGGIPMNMLPAFWMTTTDKIAIASDLLASVPLITLAAMTGSYFALAKLGERWSGRDYSDERMVTPKLASVSPISSNEALRTHSPGAGGQMGGAARVKYNLQDGLSQSVADKEQEALRVGSEVARDWSKGGRFSTGWAKAVQRAKTDHTQVGQAWAQAVSFADEMLKDSAFGDKISDGARSDLSVGLQTSVNAAIMGTGLNGVAAGDYSLVGQKGKEWITTTKEGQKWAEQVRSEFSKTQYTALQGTDTLTTNAGYSDEEAAAIRESITTQASVTKAYEQATQVAASIGGTYSGHAGELHNNLVAAGMYQPVMGMHSALYNGVGADSDRYREAYDRIERHEQGLQVQAYDAQLGWAVGAMLSSGQYDRVMEVGQHLTGARGLDTPASGSNKGVGAPVTTLEGNTLEDLKARHGAAPAGPAVAPVNPVYRVLAEQEGGANFVEVPDRPTNNSPARPQELPTRTEEEVREAAKQADVNATAATLGTAGYMLDETRHRLKQALGGGRQGLYYNPKIQEEERKQKAAEK